MKGIAKELNSLGHIDAKKHENRPNKLPLGRLIGEAEKYEIFEKDEFDRIRSFNEKRRWVVHNSIFESGSDLYTDSGRDEVFSKLEAFVNEAKLLHSDIGKLVVEYSASKGMSKQKIYDIANNHIAKLKGET